MHVAQLPLLTVVPFVALLLVIALAPLGVPRWWHHNRNKALVAFLISVPVLFYLGRTEIGRQLLLEKAHEYVGFIVVIGALFMITGGIHIEGSLAAMPRAYRYPAGPLQYLGPMGESRRSGGAESRAVARARCDRVDRARRGDGDDHHIRIPARDPDLRGTGLLPRIGGAPHPKRLHVRAIGGSCGAVCGDLRHDDARARDSECPRRGLRPRESAAVLLGRRDVVECPRQRAHLSRLRGERRRPARDSAARPLHRRAGARSASSFAACGTSASAAVHGRRSGSGAWRDR